MININISRMGDKMRKTVSVNLKNFWKAVRYVNSFANINLYDIWSQVPSTYDGMVGVKPKDLLCGLKKIKALGKSKSVQAYNSYIKELSKVWKKYDLYEVDRYENEDNLMQYPAPPAVFYINYIIYNHRRLAIDDAIKLIDMFIKNSKKSFVDKKIPDVGVKYMFDRDEADALVWLYDEKMWNDSKLLNKIIELIEIGEKAGSRNALFEKATHYAYYPFKGEEAANATEKLITKYKDYRAFGKYGYVNTYIKHNKLIKYYNEAIKHGYHVEEELAHLISGQYPYYSSMKDYKTAMEIRKKAYSKYKKIYQRDKTAKVYYGYAAYCLGKATLDEWIKVRLQDPLYQDENDYKKLFAKKDSPYKNWIGYIKEAKKLLKPGFMEPFPFTCEEDYEERSNLEDLIFSNIDNICSFNIEGYYREGVGPQSY